LTKFEKYALFLLVYSTLAIMALGCDETAVYQGFGVRGKMSHSDISKIS